MWLHSGERQQQKDYVIMHQNNKRNHEKYTADSSSECVIVLNGFVTGWQILKLEGTLGCPSVLYCYFWSSHNFLLQMIQEVSVGKAQLGG